MRLSFRFGLLLLAPALAIGWMASFSCITRPRYTGPWPPEHPPGYVPPPNDIKERLITAAKMPRPLAISDLEFTPDGKFLIAASASGSYKLDANTLEVLSTYEPALNWFSIHPGGEFLATSTTPYEVECSTAKGKRVFADRIAIRRVSDGQMLREIHLPVDALVKEMFDAHRRDVGRETCANLISVLVPDLLFSPDGKSLAAEVGYGVQLYETETWTLRGTLQLDDTRLSARGMAFTADSGEIGIEFLGGDREGHRLFHYFFFDLASLQPTRKLCGHSGEDHHISFSTPRDGRFLLGRSQSPSGTNVLSIWKPDADGPPDEQYMLDDGDYGWTTPSGEVYVSPTRFLQLWDIAKRETFFFARLPVDAKYYAISPDSKRAAVVQGWNAIFLFDIERKGAPAVTVPGDRPVPKPEPPAQSDGQSGK